MLRARRATSLASRPASARRSLRRALSAASAWTVAGGRTCSSAGRSSSYPPRPGHDAVLRRRSPAGAGGYAWPPLVAPSHQPWDRRLCVVPEGDLFQAITDGRASVVTDRSPLSPRRAPAGVGRRTSGRLYSPPIRLRTRRDPLAISYRLGGDPHSPSSVGSPATTRPTGATSPIAGQPLDLAGDLLDHCRRTLIAGTSDCWEL